YDRLAAAAACVLALPLLRLYLHAIPHKLSKSRRTWAPNQSRGTRRCRFRTWRRYRPWFGRKLLRSSATPQNAARSACNLVFILLQILLNLLGVTHRRRRPDGLVRLLRTLL